MKLLISGDWHFHAYKAHSHVTKSGDNSRLVHLAKAWGEMIGIAENNGAETLCLVGDIFHVRGSVKPSVFNLVHHLIAEAGKKLKVVGLPGNHDMEDYKGGATSVDLFDKIKNSYFGCIPSTMTINKTTFGIIPFQNSAKEWEEAAKKLGTGREIDVWLSHQGIDDFKPSAAMSDFMMTVESVQKIVGTETPAFFGHYHRPGVRDNIYQVGAPVMHHWGDAGSPHGVTFYDTETKEAQFHPLRSHPVFHVVNDSTPMPDVKEGDFIKIKACDMTTASLIKRNFDGKKVADFVIEIEKKFETAHKEAMKIGTVPEMVCQWADLREDIKPHKEAMLNIYKEACS